MSLIADASFLPLTSDWEGILDIVVVLDASGSCYAAVHTL